MKCNDVPEETCKRIHFKCAHIGLGEECPHYKEPNMNDKIAVHVPNRYLWEAVEKHEVEVRGKRWACGQEYLGYQNNYSNDTNCISVADTDIFWSKKSYWEEEGYAIITVDEYFKRYGEDSPIKIGQYEVKNIDSEGFSVGCQRVTWETYDKIGAKRPKE